MAAEREDNSMQYEAFKVLYFELMDCINELIPGCNLLEIDIMANNEYMIIKHGSIVQPRSTESDYNDSVEVLRRSLIQAARDILHLAAEAPVEIHATAKNFVISTDGGDIVLGFPPLHLRPLPTLPVGSDDDNALDPTMSYRTPEDDSLSCDGDDEDGNSDSGSGSYLSGGECAASDYGDVFADDDASSYDGDLPDIAALGLNDAEAVTAF